MRTLFGSKITGHKVEISQNESTEPGGIYEVHLSYKYIPDVIVERVAPAIARAIDKWRDDIELKYVGIDTAKNKIVVQFKDTSHQVPIAQIIFAIIAALGAIAVAVIVDRIYRIFTSGDGAAKGSIFMLLVILFMIYLMSRR